MKNSLFLIINYHGISEQAGKDRYSISRNNFEKQLQCIQTAGVPVIPADHSNSPAGFSISITFDDGNISDTDIVAPLLEKYGYPATFFPHTSIIGKPGKVGWSDLQHLVKRGFKIGSHGISHTALPLCSPQGLHNELRFSKEVLEDKTGVSIKDLALPYGAYNSRVTRMARMVGYKDLYSTGLRINNGNDVMLSRWNMTTDISDEKFRSIVSSGGKLPFDTKLVAYLKHWSKQVIGPGLIHSRNQN